MRAISLPPSFSSTPSGFSLIEVIVFIVIVSAVMAGMIPVFSMAAKISADPLFEKQSLAYAQALLEEIESQRSCGIALPTTMVSSDRTSFTCVENYNKYTGTAQATGSIYSMAGQASTVTGAVGTYTASVAITQTTMLSLTTQPVNVNKIAVTVTGPDSRAYTVYGYVPY